MRMGRIRHRLLVATVSISVVTVSCLTVAGGEAGAAVKQNGGVSPQSSLQCAPGLGTGSPGVTPTQVNIAAISTLTGPISAGFSAVVPGAQAYFNTVNAHGGVNGRKINLAYNLNDLGTGSRFGTETHTAIDQDHAFAVLASSYWFSPTYFAATCTPTYGFNVTGNLDNLPQPLRRRGIGADIHSRRRSRCEIPHQEGARQVGGCPRLRGLELSPRLPGGRHVAPEGRGQR